MNFYKILLLSVLLTTQCYSQTNSVGLHKIKINLQFIPTEKVAPTTLYIGYNVFYPYCELISDPVKFSLLENSKVISLDVSSLIIQVGYGYEGIVAVAPDDTIQFTIKDNKAVMIGDKVKYRYFERNKRNEFDANHIYPFLKVNTLPLPEYRNYCLEYFQKEQEYIDNYFADKEPVLKKFFLDQSKHLLINNLYKGIAQKNYTREYIPETYLKIFDTSFYNHPGIYFDAYYGIALENYNSFLAQTYNDSIPPLILQTTSDTYYKLIESAKKNFSTPLYHYLLMGYMRTISSWGTSLVSDVAHVIHNELNKAKLDSAVHMKMEKCYEDFTKSSHNLKQYDNVKIKTIDNRILNLKDITEKGKYTYIDFWASWCGACIPELPFIKKYKEKYKNIQFITLSIDQDEALWKNAFLKFQQAKQNSFLLVNGLKNKITMDYNVQSIPRFLLFDKKGKCISQSEVRPSDPMFESYIEKLLYSPQSESVNK